MVTSTIFFSLLFSIFSRLFHIAVGISHSCCVFASMVDVLVIFWKFWLWILNLRWISRIDKHIIQLKMFWKWLAFVISIVVLKTWKQFDGFEIDFIFHFRKRFVKIWKCCKWKMCNQNGFFFFRETEAPENFHWCFKDTKRVKVSMNRSNQERKRTTWNELKNMFWKCLTSLPISIISKAHFWCSNFFLNWQDEGWEKWSEYDMRTKCLSLFLWLWTVERNVVHKNVFALRS